MSEKNTPNNPLRNVYFGELHCHTAYSLDGFVAGALNTPDDAYSFGKGEGRPLIVGSKHIVKLKVPLDFMAVTDHSEWMGEMSMILDEDFDVDNPEFQQKLETHRADHAAGGGIKAAMEVVMTGMVSTRPSHQPYAEAEDKSSREHLRSMWRYMVDTANKHYEPGKFTTFVGYEWSATPNGANLHRNVIFRTDNVPEAPLSYIDTQNPEDLWRWMQEQGGAPDNVLAIPHNPNLSIGLMFLPKYFDGRDIDLAYAETRSLMEPLIEIHQIKGNSEANPALSTTDEFANFEQPSGLTGELAESQGSVALSSYTYVRDGLKEGLRQADRLGVNPFKYGLIGSTDTHLGTPGDTEEDDWSGHFPNMDTTPEARLLSESEEIMSQLEENPGGLAGVWAEENTRDGIFHALRRREAFGTSGVRIKPRFFGGWAFTEADGAADNFVEIGYEKGVPMGSDLPPRQPGASPSFMVWATKDALSGNLDRIQIVKGWSQRGEVFEKIYDLAWSGDRQPNPKTGELPPVGNTVNVAEATYTNDIGAEELSAVWTDPDFDPAVRAFYYARIIEIPTPRWSTYDAKRLGIEAPEPAAIQERAWTSSIWYTPSEADLQVEAEEEVFTVTRLEAQGIAPLTTEELEELTVGKTLTTRHLVTGQEASVHYAVDGIRTIFFGPHQVVRSPYEIKDGMRIEQTAQGIEITVKIYKVGDRYIATRADQGGFANFEILPE
jgi:hypothetical protein